MPTRTDQDYMAFRKYIGDFSTEAVDEDEIDAYLDDATTQAVAPHVTPDSPMITSYDNLNQRYAPEVILLAAINWWWNKAGQYADKLTTTIGQASENASDRWTHAMEMIQFLQQMYDSMSVLGKYIDTGNLSHWNRNTLSRVGGQSEEDAKKAIIPNTP